MNDSRPVDTSKHKSCVCTVWCRAARAPLRRALNGSRQSAPVAARAATAARRDPSDAVCPNLPVGWCAQIVRLWSRAARVCVCVRKLAASGDETTQSCGRACGCTVGLACGQHSQRESIEPASLSPSTRYSSLASVPRTGTTSGATGPPLSTAARTITPSMDVAPSPETLYFDGAAPATCQKRVGGGSFTAQGQWAARVASELNTRGEAAGAVWA